MDSFITICVLARRRIVNNTKVFQGTLRLCLPLQGADTNPAVDRMKCALLIACVCVCVCE